MKATHWAIFFLTLCVHSLFAQNNTTLFQPDPTYSRLFWNEWKTYAQSDPKIPIQFESPKGAHCSFDGYAINGQPQFLCTCNNLDAAKTTGTNQLWNGGGLGLSLSGLGLNKLALWDGGAVRTTHYELAGRVTVMDTPSTISGHTTAVAGNMVATGINPNAKGMSFQTQLRNWNFANDNAEIIGAGPDLFLSNHSYASVVSWTYVGSNLYWYGDTALNMYKEWKFGYYDNRSRIWDSMMYANPYYLMVKAAGNDRGVSMPPGTPHYYWNGTAWALTNTTRDTVGPYDCISTFGNAKNLLTVGAIQVMPNGYTGPSSVNMLSYSSWGPSDDGRIKPDLVAASGSILSTGDAHDSAYANLGGTSIAAPNVTGSLMLLQQLHFQLKNRYMRNATLKGLAIHTANRCKNNPGPDYECGWGIPNLPKAANCLLDSVRNSIFEENLLNADSFTKDIYLTAGDTIRATLAWTDPKGSTGAPAYNDTTPKLVNDLDLRLYNLGGQVLASPFILNPANPSLPATHGDNFRDNVEQIYVVGLGTGRYRFKVKHKGLLLNSVPQNFSLIISGAPLYSAVTPVDWLDVFATQTNWNEAQVSWKIARELNIKYYLVEYSLDGNDFFEAGKLIPKSTGQSGVRIYAFQHLMQMGLPNLLYYRIKQIDVDGQFSYSKTIQLQIDNSWRINGVYPNPFTQIITLNMNGGVSSENLIQVYNLLGELKLEKSASFAGEKQISLDLGTFPNGMYLLIIEEINSGKRYLRKIVKGS